MSRREQRKRKRMSELGEDSAEKNTDSDDDSSSIGMINYLDRLTNVIERFSRTEDAAIGNKIVKV